VPADYPAGYSGYYNAADYRLADAVSEVDILPADNVQFGSRPRLYVYPLPGITK
jgi:hypothetical protein